MQPIPAGHHTVTPVLTLDDAAQAIKWYEKAFGAKEIGRSTAPDGKILHAEIQIGDSRIMLNDPVMGRQESQIAERFAGVAVDLRGGLRRAV